MTVASPQTEVSHADILKRLEAGDQRFRSIEGMVSDLARKHADSDIQRTANADTLAEIKQAVAILPKLKEAVDDTKGLVETWTTLRNMGRFAKWAAPVLALLGFVVFVIRTAGTWFVQWGHPTIKP